MKAGTLISALRVGRSLENPTPYKWFGLACSLGGLILVALSALAAARGWINASLSLSDAVLLVSLVLGPLFAVSAHSQVTTTDKIGFPSRGDPAPERVRATDRLEDLPSGHQPPARQNRHEHDGIDDRLGGFGDQ